MYIENLKIALDDDSATYYDIKAVYSLLPDLAVAWPKPKTTYLNINGVNGGADLTEALGGVSYDYRQLTLRLTTRKDGLLAPDVAVNEFAKDYDGQRVRIKVLATSASASDYFFRGRLSITADDENKEIRQITCNIYAEPLRYSTSYTPSASGADITPAALGTNLWNTTNVIPSDVHAETVTASGGTVVANAPYIEGEGNEFIIVAQTDNKLLRIYLQDFVNCTAEVRMNGKTVRAGVGSAVLMGAGQITINVFRTNIAQAASFGCTIREIATHTVINTGKSVPFTIEHAFTSGSEYKPKLYVNGTIFSLGTVTGSGVWREYAPAMLKSGENIIAAYVDIASYDPAESDGTVKYRYRGGVL